ncbi:hypothetical protein PG999_008559 [Apiospora kogelbergensis]|uniref:Oxidase ustYa n=1 Tax=Apiospora kogelbergensis TaxID=1337665 RepID=A0AAW0QGP9_9PEZI
MADREGLLAETEMDGREKYQWIRPERRTCMTTLQSFSWLVNLILLMINTIGLLYLVHSMSGAQSPDSACPIQVGGDYTHEGPIFLTNVQKWKADPDFTPLSATEFLKPKTQAKWGSLIPAGSDFGEDGKVYNTTSVTHQIHCVYIMGKIFSSVLSNSTDIGIPSDYEAHFLHCVDYMRQAAMCAGDVTIEPRDDNGSPGPVTLENAFNGYHEQVKTGARHILPIDD